VRERILVAVLTLGALGGCANRQRSADEAMGDVASVLGRSTEQIEFAELHADDEGNVVCGFANGEAFYSAIVFAKRKTILVDDVRYQDLRDGDATMQQWLRCLNDHRPIRL
jgi:hypothetical protein